MTLGGIAAAIGLVIDDAIVVVEAIHTRKVAGRGIAELEAVERGIGEILRPLVGSTLTPVVVFIPLAFLDGITGVFFRALALTMVVSLLMSLVLAVTLTPSLAGLAGPSGSEEQPPPASQIEQGGPLLTAGHRASTSGRCARRSATGGARWAPAVIWSWSPGLCLYARSWTASSSRPWTKAAS